MMFPAVPAKGGFLFLLLTGAALGTAFMNPGLMTALVAALLSGVLVSSFLMAQFALYGITVTRKTAAEDAVCGSTVRMELEILNRFPFYRNSLVVTESLPFTQAGMTAFTVPALSPGERLLLPREIRAEKRGEYQLEKITLCSGDYFGLFLRKKVFRLPAQIVIRPKVVPLESLPVRYDRSSVMSSEGRNLGHAGRGTEFFGVRPYRIGDEMRHIHWKSTAAKGRLMVKEFEAAAIDNIVILLDTCEKEVGFDPEESNFESLITAASSVVEYLSRKYCHLTFMADLGDDFCRIGGDAAGVRFRILQALTGISPQKRPFSGLLNAAAEIIPSGSIVFLLSMSVQEIPEVIGMWEELHIFTNWLYAPKEAFPPVEPDEPRTVRLKQLRGKMKFSGDPYLLTFNSDLQELLKSEDPYEKI